MHWSRSRVVPLVFSLGLAACQNGGGGGHGSVSREQAPTSFAEFICAQQDSCACDSPFGSTTECVDTTSDEFGTALAEAEAAGLTYNPECLGQYFDAYELVGCRTISELLEDGTFGVQGGQPLACKVVVGTGAEGDPCTSHWQALGDSCIQGLFCAGDVCESVTIPDPKPVGSDCDPQADLCVDGAACTNSPGAPETFSCTMLPALGESCMDLLQCQEGSHCDTSDFTCKAPVGAGEPCTSPSMCQAGLYCDFTGGTCAPTLAEGQPCDSGFSCADGLQCDTDPDTGEDVCMPESPLICI